MPVFETSQSLVGRGRSFSRAQAPLLVGALFVFVEGVWAVPSAASSASALSGMALIVGASAAFFAVPWKWWSTRSMLPLAVIDIFGVALLRLAYFDRLPSVGMLAVFPVVWLAYAFSRWVIVVAVAGATFITMLPLLVEGKIPSTRLEVAGVITLPVLITGLAVALGESARQLTASQRRIEAANRELQESLKQVRDSDRLSRTLFESVEVALAFYDTDNRLVMANTLAEQAVAAAGFDLHHPPYAGPNVRRADNRTVIPFDEQVIPRALRGDLESHEMEWVGPVGHQVAIIAHAQQVLRSDGAVWGTLIAVYNVTDLARSMRVKDDFIATVSHELRTPLTSVLGYLELLSDELPDVPLEQMAARERYMSQTVERIRRGALNLEQRIQELLDAADRRRALDLVPTDVSLLASRVALSFATQAQAAGLDLTVSTTQPEWSTLDPSKMEQAVENLVSNAVKYTSGPGTVTLAVVGDDDYVDVVVTDTGIGMSSDEVDQAFDAFWRADHARDHAVQGIGIGLGLVRDVCEAHRATVSISSEVGRGTTATIRLPRRF